MSGLKGRWIPFGSSTTTATTSGTVGSCSELGPCAAVSLAAGESSWDGRRPDCSGPWDGIRGAVVVVACDGPSRRELDHADGDVSDVDLVAIG